MPLNRRARPVYPNILSNRKIVPRSLLITSWKLRVAKYGRLYDTVKIAILKGSATLSIAALGIAVAYLLLIIAGATGALSVLVWLFRDTPDVDRRTGRETFRGLRDTDHSGLGSIPWAQAESEHPEDRVA